MQAKILKEFKEPEPINKPVQFVPTLNEVMKYNQSDLPKTMAIAYANECSEWCKSISDKNHHHRQLSDDKLQEIRNFMTEQEKNQMYLNYLHSNQMQQQFINGNLYEKHKFNYIDFVKVLPFISIACWVTPDLRQQLSNYIVKNDIMPIKGTCPDYERKNPRQRKRLLLNNRQSLTPWLINADVKQATEIYEFVKAPALQVKFDLQIEGSNSACVDTGMHLLHQHIGQYEPPTMCSFKVVPYFKNVSAIHMLILHIYT